MVGICGVVGDGTAAVDGLVDGLTWTGREATASTATGEVAVGAATHPSEPPSGPAPVPGRDATVWLWGGVWGFDGPDGYETVETEPAAFAAGRYDEQGIGFVEGLNGSFAGVVHDRDAERVQLFTDRLGTRPVHYARTDGGAVFSTDVQSLPRHPSVPRGFDVDALAEYFTLQRPFGLETPLEGIELLPPGSITTIDLGDGSLETSRYWEPRYEPEDRPRSYFVDRLATFVERVVEERSSPDATYGLLLSGGSDSRLALAALPTRTPGSACRGPSRSSGSAGSRPGSPNATSRTRRPSPTGPAVPGPTTATSSGPTTSSARRSRRTTT